MKTFVAELASLGVGCIAMALAAGASAAEIKVMASAAFKEAYGELVPAFETSSGHKVTTIWAGTNDVVKRIGAGETVDLVIIAGPAIDQLIKQGKLLAGSRVDVAKSGIGVAVRSGAPRIDMSSGDALKTALLGAKSIAYSSGPSGAYMAALLQKWGVADQLKSRVTQVSSGVPVGEVVAKGEAEIGFQQVSELLPIKGIDLLGPLPADIQEITVFSAGLPAAAPAPDAAQALVKFLTSPAAAPVIRQKGMEPG
jgi:molybdate transport system substrate-binding protein